MHREDTCEPQAFLILCTDISHHDTLGRTHLQWLHPRDLPTTVAWSPLGPVHADHDPGVLGTATVGTALSR